MVTFYYYQLKVRLHQRQKLHKLINLINLHITSREAQEAQGTQRTQAVDVNASTKSHLVLPQLSYPTRILQWPKCQAQ